MKNQLSANLVALMNHRHIGGAELARATGIPLSTIKNIRTGANANPTIETLIPLANYFNISLDDIVQGNMAGLKKYGSSQARAKAVPIISWENAVIWPEVESTDSQVFTEKMCNENVFALHVEQNISEKFVAPGILLIDPMQAPAHFNYVLVHKSGLARPSIKQLICDEEFSYLGSLVIADKLAPLDENYRLLGVIFEYRHCVKLINDKISNPAINKFASNAKILELVTQLNGSNK